MISIFFMKFVTKTILFRTLIKSLPIQSSIENKKALMMKTYFKECQS